MLFGVYLILNGLERFSIEKIRINTTYTLFGNEITQAEIIFMLDCFGPVYCFLFKKKISSFSKRISL